MKYRIIFTLLLSYLMMDTLFTQNCKVWVEGDSLKLDTINTINYRISDFDSITALQLYFEIDTQQVFFLGINSIHPIIESSSDLFYHSPSSTLIFLYYADDNLGVNLMDSSILFNIEIKPKDTIACYSSDIQLIDDFNELIVEQSNTDFIPLEYIPHKICVQKNKEEIEEEEEILELINFISPDHDGKNDLLHIQGIDTFQQRSIQVFNSWGQEVYQASHYNNDWDGSYLGKVLPDGHYYYILEYGNDKIKKTGTMLTILTHKK